MSLNPTRRRIVDAAQGALRTKQHWQYAEIRPIPLHTFNEVLNGASETITTDCSGLATCCYYRAGAPDPNGEGYDTTKTMYTGTMLNTLPAIPAWRARPGDLAVFGAFPGKHVIVIVGTGSDPACISHGGPGDPKEAPLSHFESIGPVTILKGVSFIAPIRKRKPTHIVSGNDGQKIGHTRHLRLWPMRHRRLVHKNQRHLHYDEIEAAPEGATNPQIHNEEE